MTSHADVKDFYECIEAARKLLLNPIPKSNGLYYLSWKTAKFIDPFSQKPDISKVRATVDILRLLRESKGAGRAHFEEHIMEVLCIIIDVTSRNVMDAGIANLSPWEIPDSIPANIKDDLNITKEMSEFAVECIEFIRPRDSLASNRRKYALEMLGNTSRIFTMPQEIFDYVFKLIKTKKHGAPVAGALQFLESFYKIKGTDVPLETEEILLRFVLKTDSHGLAVGALNILVEAGNICEITALEHIDEWKERNYY